MDRAWVAGLLAGAVRWLCTIFATVLAVHVLLTIGGANPANPITSWVAESAQAVVLQFNDLFTPDDPRLRVLLNHGLAAVFWVLVGGLLSTLIRRLP